MSLDPALARGAAAALFALGATLPLAAQAVGSVQVRPRRDSVFVRVIDASMQVRIDSIFVLSRALEEEAPLSPRGMELRRELETMMTSLRAASVRVGGSGGGGVARIMLSGPEGMRQLEPSRSLPGWLGFTTGSVPHDEWSRNESYFVRYFAYPSIASVEPNSPAQRAGIVPGDVLVAYDRTDVVGHEINLTQLLVPDRRLSVTVRRDGETRDFAMTVEKAPQRIFFRRLEPGEMPPQAFPALAPGEVRVVERARGGGGGGAVAAGGVMGGARGAVPAIAGRPYGDYTMVGPTMGRGIFLGTDGVFGASLISLKPELAAALKLEMGVLVEQVPEETPAYRAGLRAGDVIVNVAGQPVSTVRDVRFLIASRAGDRAIPFQVIRDKKSKALIVKW